MSYVVAILSLIPVTFATFVESELTAVYILLSTSVNWLLIEILLFKLDWWVFKTLRTSLGSTQVPNSLNRSLQTVASVIFSGASFKAVDANPIFVKAVFERH